MIERKADLRFIYSTVPDDPALLIALARVTIRHSFLDRILRMTVKSFTGVTPREALDATRFQGSSTLRERVGKLARSVLGEGRDLVRLQAILSRCKDVTERRNELTHAIWAHELDGDPVLIGEDHSERPLPSAAAVEQLADDIELLTNELNDARLRGWLGEAIARTGKVTAKAP